MIMAGEKDPRRVMIEFPGRWPRVRYIRIFYLKVLEGKELSGSQQILKYTFLRNIRVESCQKAGVANDVI